MATPEGPGLKNSIYDQQTRSGRRMTPARRWAYRLAVPLALGLIRLGWRWCRIRRVLGEEHLTAVLARAPSFIPAYWHQHQLLCGKYLFDASARGLLKPGLLVSPSVDGEFGALLGTRLGGTIIRGSSTHTGARALRDFYQALVKEGVSPVIAADGPKGPRYEFKPGALLLAQLSQRPILPMSYCASRAWQISWDRFVIPKPFARVVIALGEPVYVPKGLDAQALSRLQGEMQQRLKALFEQARASLERDG